MTLLRATAASVVLHALLAVGVLPYVLAAFDRDLDMHVLNDAERRYEEVQPSPLAPPIVAWRALGPPGHGPTLSAALSASEEWEEAALEAPSSDEEPMHAAFAPAARRAEDAAQTASSPSRERLSRRATRPQQRRRASLTREPAEQAASVPPSPAPVAEQAASMPSASQAAAARALLDTADAIETVAKGELVGSPRQAADGQADRVLGAAQERQGSTAGAALAGHEDGPAVAARPAETASLEAYTERVRTVLAESIRYPRRVRRAGLEGKVVLDVTIDASGTVLAVEVYRSSGHDVLDRAALDAVRSVARLPAPPRSLQWTTRQVRVGYAFRLS